MGDSKFAEMCALAANLKDKQEPEMAFHLLLFQQQTVEMCEARWIEERDKWRQNIEMRTSASRQDGWTDMTKHNSRCVVTSVSKSNKLEY